MKPGMTGYWQIHKNENISFDKCTEMDLNYIRKAGVWTDFKSLLKSIPAILTGKGCRRQTK
ncbi:MAG: sugar transferase [Anaerolineaceae bacterium]|nr:sugar transferase [Anaerolineaceae bacterium]